MLFLIGKIILGLYFIYSGINHFKHKDSMAGYAKSKGVKAPKAGVIFTGLLLFFGGLGILTGLFFNIALALILIFLIPTSFIMHAFWKETDASAKSNEKIAFMKNIALAGAIMMMF